MALAPRDLARAAGHRSIGPRVVFYGEKAGGGKILSSATDAHCNAIAANTESVVLYVKKQSLSPCDIHSLGYK